MILIYYIVVNDVEHFLACAYLPPVHLHGKISQVFAHFLIDFRFIS